MRRSPRSTAIRLVIALSLVCLSTMPAFAQVSLRSVKVLGGKDTVEIEVEASDRVVPQTRVLTGPDRLVVDFPNAVPSSQVRSQSVDRGDVKDVRVGLFQSNPPMTRVVVDLKSARSYQIFPSGRTVMIKVMGSGAGSAEPGVAYEPVNRPGYAPAAYTRGAGLAQVASAPRTPLEVTYRNGLLSIVSNKATLSEILYAVQQRTGADIPIPAGAEQERVVAEFEPAPAPEVLARLLNGSDFNFLILSAPDDPRHLDRVILSARDGGSMPIPFMQSEVAQPAQADADAEPNAPAAANGGPGTLQPDPDNAPMDPSQDK